MAHGREVKVSTFAHVTATLPSKFKMMTYPSFPSLIPIAPVVCLTETSPGGRPRKWKKAQVERTEDRARERAKLYHQPCKGGLTGLVYFDPTDAYHFSLNLPETFLQSMEHFLAHLCSKEGGRKGEGKEGSLPSHLPTGTAQTDERRWMGKYVN